MKKLLVTLSIGIFVLSACASDDEVIFVSKSGTKKYRIIKRTNENGVSKVIYK